MRITIKNKILIVALILMIAPSLAFAQTTVRKVESNLMCYRYLMTLSSCESSMGDEMRAKIKSMINQGKDKNQIIASFVSLYGEKILIVPSKKGFNLTVWITPFLVIGIVGLILFKSMKQWSEKKPIPNINESQKLHQEYGEKLKKELDNFKEGDDI